MYRLGLRAAARALPSTSFSSCSTSRAAVYAASGPSLVAHDGSPMLLPARFFSGEAATPAPKFQSDHRPAQSHGTSNTAPTTSERRLPQLGRIEQPGDLRMRMSDLFSAGRPASSEALLYALKNCRNENLNATPNGRVQLADYVWALAQAHPNASQLLQLENFNAYISVFVVNMNHLPIVAFKKLMEKYKVAPNHTTYYWLTQAYALQGDVNGARATLDTYLSIPKEETLVFKGQPEPRYQSHRETSSDIERPYSWLLRALLRDGNIEAADALLAEMSTAGVRVTTLTYDAIFHACCERNLPDYCLATLESAMKAGVNLSSKTYEAILQAFTSNGQLENVKLVLQMQAKAGKLVFDPEQIYRFISGAFYGDVTQADEAFVKLGRRIDRFTISIILGAFAARGDVTNMLRFCTFLDERSHGNLSSQHLSSIFSTFIKANDPDAAYNHFNLLRNLGKAPRSREIYAKCIASMANSDLSTTMANIRINELRSMMRRDHISLDRESLNSILSVWSTATPSRDVSFAQIKASLAVADGMDRTTDTWHHLLAAHANSNAPDSLARLNSTLQEMLASGENMTPATYKILISAYARRGDLDGVSNVISQLKSEKLISWTNAELFTPIIAHFVRCQDFDNAYQILATVSPVASNFHPLFDACVRDLNTDRVTHLLTLMREHNVDPDTYIYNSLFEIYGRTNNTESVLTLLRSMTPDVIVGQTPRNALLSVLHSSADNVMAVVKALHDNNLVISSTTQQTFRARRHELGLPDISYVFSDDGVPVQDLPVLQPMAMAVKHVDAQMITTMLENVRATRPQAFDREVQYALMNVRDQIPNGAAQVAFVKDLSDRLNVSLPALCSDMLALHAKCPQPNWLLATEFIEALPTVIGTETVPHIESTFARLCQSDTPILPELAMRMLKGVLLVPPGLRTDFIPSNPSINHFVRVFYPPTVAGKSAAPPPGKVAAAIIAAAQTYKTPITPKLARETARSLLMKWHAMEDARVMLMAANSYDSDLLDGVIAYLFKTNNSSNAMEILKHYHGGVVPAAVQAELAVKMSSSGCLTTILKSMLTRAIGCGLLDLNSEMFEMVLDQGKNDARLMEFFLSQKKTDTDRLTPRQARVLLEHYVRQDANGMALSCFKRLKELKVPLDSSVYADAIAAETRSANVSGAQALVDEATEAGLVFTQPQSLRLAHILLGAGPAAHSLAEGFVKQLKDTPLHLRNAILLYEASHGSLEKAAQLFAELKKDKQKIDDRTYNAIIRAYAMHGDLETAEKYLEELVASGETDAPIIPFNTLLGRCKVLQKPELALRLMQRLKALKIKPNERSYEHCFELFAAINKPEEAVALYRESVAFARPTFDKGLVTHVLLAALIDHSHLKAAMDVMTSLPDVPAESLQRLMRAFLETEDLAQADRTFQLATEKLGSLTPEIAATHTLGTFRIRLRKGEALSAIEPLFRAIVGLKITNGMTATRALELWLAAKQDEAVFRLLADRHHVTVPSMLSRRGRSAASSTLGAVSPSGGQWTGPRKPRQ